MQDPLDGSEKILDTPPRVAQHEVGGPDLGIAAECYAPLLREFVTRGREEDLAAIREVGAALAEERAEPLAVAETHADAMTRLCEMPPTEPGAIVFARLSEAEVELLEAFERVRRRISTPLPSAWNKVIARDSAVEELFVALAHELRTPLTPILTWAELGAESALDPDTRRAAMQVIERSARRLLRTIDDVSVASRIANDSLRVARDSIDLHEVVERAATAHVGTAESRGVELQVAVGSDVVPVVGDARRLEQAIGNLISNGIKFTSGGGVVKVQVETSNGLARLSVRDSGCGIAPEFQKRLFEEIASVDVQETRRHSGLGLGLSVARFLIEAHGGTLKVESPGVGRGAVAVLEIPLAVADQAPETRTPAGERTLAGLRILVVDDEIDAARSIEQILRSWGVAVQVATSALDALAILDRDDIDILVCDLLMPRHDGFALIGAVRERACGSARRLPALAMSACTREADRAKALRAGFDGVVSKPWEVRELAETLSSLDPRGADRLRARSATPQS